MQGKRGTAVRTPCAGPCCWQGFRLQPVVYRGGCLGLPQQPFHVVLAPIMYIALQLLPLPFHVHPVELSCAQLHPFYVVGHLVIWVLSLLLLLLLLRVRLVWGVLLLLLLLLLRV